MIWGFIIDLLRSPDAQQDAYTWGAALLGHFAIGLFVTAALAGGSALLTTVSRWIAKWFGSAPTIPRIDIWKSAALVGVGYLALWEGAQLALFGGGIADGLVDTAAVTCGAVVAAGAWRNRGAAVGSALALLAVIGVAGVRKRR